MSKTEPTFRETKLGTLLIEMIENIMDLSIFWL